MQVDSSPPEPPRPAPVLAEPQFHDASDTVRFQVNAAGAAVNASITRQALRHRFGAGETLPELLASFAAHSPQIHAVVQRRLTEGALEPVMLREAHFTQP